MDAVNEPVIELSDLIVRYGKLHALDGLSLTACRGEIYGFLGRNGAGKTTTLRVLMGVVKANAGSIKIFGEPARKIPVSIKRRIGYVSQEQNFYPWMTGRRLGRFVARFYPDWDGAEFERLLKVLDIDPNRRSAELSGGTRTKLALALALAPRPPLLLLDEPTTGLDPVARREFNELVAAMAAERGTSVFFSSHLVSEVESIASRVGIVDSGRMRIEGHIGELQARVKRIASVQPLETLATEEGSAGLQTHNGFEAPPGFEHVREDIWRAEPQLWEERIGLEGCIVRELSLEEIFFAYARSDKPLTAAA